mmetsp:Transcript_43266/g.108417  ORF Transcript_43266/g.108417 Transcript_43266/m.108417 type:complete len:223 (+) Transcript_43266:2-670(+)
MGRGAGPRACPAHRPLSRCHRRSSAAFPAAMRGLGGGRAGAVAPCEPRRPPAPAAGGAPAARAGRVGSDGRRSAGSQAGQRRHAGALGPADSRAAGVLGMAAQEVRRLAGQRHPPRSRSLRRTGPGEVRADVRPGCGAPRLCGGAAPLPFIRRAAQLAALRAAGPHPPAGVSAAGAVPYPFTGAPEADRAEPPDSTPPVRGAAALPAAPAPRAAAGAGGGRA